MDKRDLSYIINTLREIFKRLLFSEKIPILYIKRKKIGYIRNPKVASSSISKCLILSEKNIKAIQNPDDIYEESKNLWVTFDDIKMQNFFLFTFVRNPFERIVSAYLNRIYLQQNYILRSSKGLFWNTMSFSEFVNRVRIIPDRLLNGHFRSQYYLLKRFIEIAHIGKYENIKMDFAYIAIKHGLPKLEVLNKSETTMRWQDYYTPKLARLVYRRYKKDFDKWYPDEYEKLMESFKKRNTT